MTRIDPGWVKALLPESPLACEVAFFEETPSTNLAAKALAAAGAAHGTLVLCDRQTAGRGRRGRSWASDDGASVCMSLLLRPGFSPELAPRITIAAALGVCKALRSFGADAAIKWPNDIHANGKKLCGILSEMGVEDGRLSYIVCGIGINVGQNAFEGELKDIATSLMLETGRTPAREDVIAAVVRGLEPCFAACGQDEAYAGLMEEYRSLSCTLGRQVTVTGTGGVLHGLAEDLDPLGRLLLRTGQGEIIPIQAGDVSLRNKE